ncbi:hypothetical protein AAFC00_004931 [Neodothiora populina]|uniref:P450 monooxygenase n=1 Tax=Neodothiora populina TaxID=2781224 RepID=A0ABR3P533_9PEZI
MLSLVLFVATGVVLTVYIIVCTIRQYNALKDFDGPRVAAFTRLWLLRANSSGMMNKAFTAINDQYGSTARVAPNMLLTKDAELVKRMNAVRSPFVRSIWYTGLRLHPTRDNITSVIDESVHADFRNKMAPGYSGKENIHIEQDIDDRLLQLYDLIENKYLSTDQDFRPLDLSKTMSYFTLDVISSVAFGEAFGFIEADDDPFGYIDNLQEFLPAIILFGAYPELTQILRLPFMKFLAPKKTDKRGLGRVMGFAKDRVGERFGEKPIVRQDMLNSFIKRGLSKEQLESETLTQITAGSDSTSTALRMTLHFVVTTPSVQTRLLNEFHTAHAAGKVSRPVIRDAEARKLPYLQACIKEGLRMYPPVTGLLAKAAPPEGTKIDGKFVPGGTQIAWNSWGIMHDKAIFGVDCEIFRPERWLAKDNSDAEQARVARMTETVGLVFGYGRFGCLGRGVAMQELNKGIIETLLRFELQPLSLAKPFVERCVGFFLHTDMLFRVTRRQESTSDRETDSHVYFGDASALPGAPDE